MSKCMAQLKTARQPPQRVGPDRAQWKGDDATEDVKRRRAQRLYPLDGVTCEWNSGCDASATDRHPVAESGCAWAVEASWRSVEVRRGMVGRRGLGDRFDPMNVFHVRPWDLRPENLAVLCLRCWAERVP